MSRVREQLRTVLDTFLAEGASQEINLSFQMAKPLRSDCRKHLAQLQAAVL